MTSQVTPSKAPTVSVQAATSTTVSSSTNANATPTKDSTTMASSTGSLAKESSIPSLNLAPLSGSQQYKSTVVTPKGYATAHCMTARSEKSNSFA